jgi:hypothetical protein
LRRRLVYEYWCLRNDIRFFRKHRENLKRLGITGPTIWFALSQFAGRWRNKITSRLRPSKPAARIELPYLETDV